MSGAGGGLVILPRQIGAESANVSRAGRRPVLGWTGWFVICTVRGFRHFVVMLPTPTQIFAQYERGEIGFAAVNEMMGLHAKGLIEEMEEDYRNPAAALLEYLLTKRATVRLVNKHGERRLREVFHALSEVKDFAPANLLWNALHLDVPLHCFLRMRREPVFRLVSLTESGSWLIVVIEHGPRPKSRVIRRKFLLQRNPAGKLRVVFK